MPFLPKIILFCALCTVAIAASAQDTTPAAAPAPATAQTAEQTPAVQATEGTPEQPASQAAPAAAAVGDLPEGISAPPEGKGQIVFFRPSKFVGGAIGYKVREDDTELGKLSNGSYFVHVADPGAHAYVVHSEAKDVLNIEVEAGETYFVIGGVTMGVLAGRPNLSPSDQAAFTAIAAKLKPAKPLKPKK
jgi:Protein of unknown function (DUF2846)